MDAAKKSEEELLGMLMSCPVKIGSIWTHYSGRPYRVFGLSISESAQEIMINYASTAISINAIPFVRPFKEWQEEVMSKVEGRMVPRFRRLNPTWK